MNIFFFLISFAFSSEINFGPYLTAVNDSSVIVKYVLKKPSISWVSWGINPKCDMYMTFFAPQKFITLPIYALQSGKDYCYRVYLPVENSTFSYIASSSTFTPFYISSASTFNFIAFTDLNSGYSTDLYNLLKNVMEDKPMFAVYFGSMTKSNDENYDFFARYAYFIKKIPFYIPIIEQNFDYQTSSALRDFVRFFHFSYNGNSPYYYYFDNGNARFVFVDLIKSQQDSRFLSNQIEWLKKTFSSNQKTWLFVISNDNLFSYDSQKIKKIHDVIIKYNPDFIIQYGSKGYSREKISYNNSQLQSIVITLGEKRDFNINESKNIEQAVLVNEFKTDYNGVLKLSVNPSKVELTYLDYSMKKLDYLVYQK